MTTGIEFYFDPTRKGIQIFLGPAQARLMEIAWRHGYITTRMARHQTGGGSELSYSFVKSVLEILRKKGLLKKKKLGRLFSYSPTIERNRFIRERVLTIEKCLKTNFGKI